MFTHPCFIRKNTPELREYLESLGYKKCQSKESGWYEQIVSKCRELFTNDPFNGYYSFGYIESQDKYYGHRSIDCGTNEELFKAIAAISNDSDYMQWFTYNNQWYLCDRDNWVEMFSVLSMGKKFTAVERDNWITYLTFFHRATVKELIEHFK